MKKNDNLDLASQVLQEQLSLLSDTPEGITVDLNKSKAILEVSKQMINIEKIRHDQESLDLKKDEVQFEKGQYILEICEKVSKGQLRYLPDQFEDQVKRIEPSK